MASRGGARTPSGHWGRDGLDRLSWGARITQIRVPGESSGSPARASNAIRVPSGDQLGRPRSPYSLFSPG